MIVVFRNKTINAPIFLCDICGEECQDGTSMAAWSPVSENDWSVARHAHKDKCLKLLEQEHGVMFTQELHNHAMQLSHNSTVQKKGKE